MVLRRAGREFYNKAASAFRCIFHTYFSMMGRNDFFCNAEPKAKMHFIAMGVVRTVETVKNQFFLLLRNPTSCITNRKAQAGFMEG